MGKTGSKATPAAIPPPDHLEVTLSTMEQDLPEANYEILPFEIYGIITEYLPLTQLFVWRQTCTYFYNVCHNVLLQRFKDKVKTNSIAEQILKKHPSLLFLYYLRYIYPNVFNIQEVPNYKGRGALFHYDQVQIYENTVHTERFEWHGFWMPNAILQLPDQDFRDGNSLPALQSNGRQIESFRPLRQKAYNYDYAYGEDRFKLPNGFIPCQSDVLEELRKSVSQISYRIQYKFNEISNNHLAGWLAVVGVGQRWRPLNREVFANDSTGYGFVMSNFYKLCGDCQGTPFHNLDKPVQNGDCIVLELTIQRKRRLKVEEDTMIVEGDEEGERDGAIGFVSTVRVFHNDKDLGILFDNILDVTQFCPYVSLDGRRSVEVTIASITME